jgi:hypothetical protein
VSVLSEVSAVSVTPKTPEVRRFRDVLYWIDGPTGYVLACDSNAGIGQRPNDTLRQPPQETGYSAAKVALMEVIAAGATPFVLTNALGGPRDEYGQQVLAGIRAAIDELDVEVVLTGSDETNVATTQTAVGVTVLGRAPAASLRLGGARVSDSIVCVGIPKDGLLVPYAEGDRDIADLRDLQRARRLDPVREILPVGSRGIAYESSLIADLAGGQVHFRDQATVDLQASAGSSTCFLVALAAEAINELRPQVRPPITVVADIVAAEAQAMSPRKVG